MHYCPRAGCHQWYHEDCLFKLKWYQMKEDVTFFENLWQFAFDETKIDAIVREVAALPRETSKYSSGFDGMPSAVLSFARQPIVKGGNYRMGNMGAVLRARHILHQALRRGIAPPDGAVEYILYTGPAPARARASDAESDTESDTVRVYGEEEGDECIVVGEKEGGRAESGSTHGDPVGAREKRVSGARFEHIRYGTVWLAYTCPECKNPI
ncbi:hypothetical protein CALCODRAFT_261221 [Calocera cornea HHB12733]|uniref:Uncharacterized protein n=1 Tax=Calocera cornea HHB12733 TaxID=1353952 RepID=A0A165GJ19_9BASI|nr:hypothetical protein CALCODRAFT_261221 [Calocera cornea HHB12733]